MATYDNVVYKRFNGTSWDIFYFTTTAESVVGLPALLDTKVDKVAGKGLSTNDYTTNEKNKLAGIASGAEVNVQSDWNATSGDALILNKPNLATVATSGSYNDLSNRPSIPSIPSVMGTSEGNTGTATTQRTINAANLKDIILYHSPAGSRPASDVSAWAKKSSLAIGDIPTGTTGSTVALGNHTHSQYLTSSALSGYATENYVNTSLSLYQHKLTAGDNINISGGNVISAKGVTLLRNRTGTSALTIHNDPSVTSVGSQIARGDTIMFEVYTSSTITSATPKILTATVSSTANSASEGRSVTFTTWTGSEMKVYSLSVARTTAGALTFGSMNYMRMYRSNTNMNITNTSWTAYIGRIWKVDN